MDKHASLLIMTYFCGLVVGIALALTASPIAFSFGLPQCQNPACNLVPDITAMLAATAITGTLLAFISLLLSRGLYRLFFAENKNP